MSAYHQPILVRRLALAALIPSLLAACEPTWQGTAPVTRRDGGSSSASASSGCGASVNVYSGDTLYSIARRCNVSVRELIEANSLTPPYNVATGMVVRMPGGAGEYVVQKGDTLLLVARRLKLDLQTFARINGKTPPYNLQLGEKLKLPNSHDTAQNAAAPSAGLVMRSPQAGGGISKLPLASAPNASSSIKPGLEPVPPPEARQTAFQPQQTLPPPNPPALAGRGFAWPVRGDVITEFGPIAKGQNNDGINIAAPRGTPVKAAENGVVAYVGNELKGFGNLLLIKHADGWMTAYAHVEQMAVRRGEVVRKGQQIANVGATGSVTAPQLHFEIRKGTEAVNPMDHIKGSPVS